MFSVHRYEAGVIRENYAESIRSRNEEQTILYVYIYIYIHATLRFGNQGEATITT